MSVCSSRGQNVGEGTCAVEKLTESNIYVQQLSEPFAPRYSNILQNERLVFFHNCQSYVVSAIFKAI